MNRHEFKIGKSEIPVLLWCIGLFIFPHILRNRLIGGFALLNVFVYGGLLYAYNQGILRIPTMQRRNIIHYVLGIIYFTVSTFLLFYLKGTGWSLMRRFLLLFIYVFPAAFVYMNIKDRNTVIRYCHILIKWLRFVCSMMCILKVLDLLLDNSIQKMIATFYENSNLLYLIRANRFVSFYGHSLTTAWFSLCLLIWATILNNIQHETRKLYIFDIAVSLVGVAIAGSKAGIILALLLLVLCNFGIKKIKYMFLILAVFFLLYTMGVFDIVIDRILEGLKIGDLTTSRNTALIRLIGDGTISFEWLRGHAIDYDSTSMIAALEYPPLRWAFTCGILFSAIMCVVYFAVPVLKVVRCRNMVVLICVLILMAFVNSNNGVSSYSDDLLFYSINIGLLIQLLTTSQKREQRNG